MVIGSKAWQRRDTPRGRDAIAPVSIVSFDHTRRMDARQVRHVRRARDET